MSAVTIKQPPCSGSTVTLNFEYSGTLNITALSPKPANTAAYKVRLRLVISRDSGAGTKVYDPVDVAPENNNTTWKYNFNVASADAGTASISARLVVDNVERDDPYSVSAYYQRSTPTASPCLGDDVLLGATERAVAGLPDAATFDPGRGRAAALTTEPPPGYEVKTFGGVIPTNGSTVAVVRCRIERRFPHPQAPTHFTVRRTISVAKSVAREFGSWSAELLIPTAHDTDAKYYVIAEFFDRDGFANYAADVRELPKPRPK
jgi:hypothetical protein